MAITFFDKTTLCLSAPCISGSAMPVVAFRAQRLKKACSLRTGWTGEPIPSIDYTNEETHVWEVAFKELSRLYPTHACKEYLETFSLFNFSHDRVPQLEELSQVLQHHTGWKIRPVAGLLQYDIRSVLGSH